MKRIIPLIVVDGIGGLFYLQKKHDLDKTSKGVRDVREQTKTHNRPERGGSYSTL